MTVKAAPEGAEITVDGRFSGNSPATFRLPAGDHDVKTVSSTWLSKLGAEGKCYRRWIGDNQRHSRTGPSATNRVRSNVGAWSGPKFRRCPAGCSRTHHTSRTSSKRCWHGREEDRHATAANTTSRTPVARGPEFECRKFNPTKTAVCEHRRSVHPPLPQKADVQVDGEYWGNTPTSDLTKFSPGTHTIVVKKAGYLPWEQKILLSPGDNRTIDAEMERKKHGLIAAIEVMSGKRAADADYAQPTVQTAMPIVHEQSVEKRTRERQAIGPSQALEQRRSREGHRRSVHIHS